jgi:hypothetical protein|tara:strand:- start:481 stop:678 length:198 start_codon:yes stop_codon:yes gene_type:complete
LKRRSTLTKHDLKRAIVDNKTMIFSLVERLLNLEKVFELYVEMNKDSKGFEDYLKEKKNETESKK